jgi:hypothetical protein
MGTKWRNLTESFFCLTLVGFTLSSLTDAPASAEGVNFIIQLSGDVKLKKDGRSAYQKASIYAPLSRKDSLQLGANASVTVLCSNTKHWKVPPGKVSRIFEGCPMGDPIIMRPDSNRSPTRGGGSDPTIPYIISPRNTAILNPLPLLRWHPVAGAKLYTVKVEVPGEEIPWTVQTKQSEVIYSGVPLKPGNYRVSVTADNMSPSVEPEKIEFTFLGNEDAQRIEAEIDNLGKQTLNEEAKTLALAYFYWGRDLNELAIERLEELVRKGDRTASVYQLLGEIYQHVGLNELARERYTSALAKVGDNLEGQARIQASLGEVDCDLKRVDDARRWYQQAQVNYRTLGDEQQVTELQQKLNMLCKVVEQ